MLKRVLIIKAIVNIRSDLAAFNSAFTMLNYCHSAPERSRSL
jgi:hypothetical protein